MCDSVKFLVIKSSSTGKLNSNEMTLLPEANLQSNEHSKLKRTFTLPRNPFNNTRMSKRKPKTKDEHDLKIDTEVNKKVFRRPSIRKFINKIAQHISGVPGINQSIENNRVPPVGLQTWGPNDTPGVTGLKNHGNTCFINAVLQCISHTDVLAEYFVLDRYKVDLSRRNKLNSKKFGTKGEVTEQLALLLKALWACQYSPELSTTFKQVVERHGAQYKGTQQHDALEFLQWLLDKVHEDLNTASKKKFKSIKTSGRPDEVIAAETLENYKRCNNSFIQGVFQAQYRSSLSCSRCRTQSNTFDPFQCISVQLPQFHKHSIYVTVLYTSQQPRQVRLGLAVPSGATISELREFLSSDTSIENDRMLLTEIGPEGFRRTFADQQLANAIRDSDPFYCIETPILGQGNSIDGEVEATSAYVLLCWINVEIDDDEEEICRRFGSPYTMQVSRETSYDDLQKLILKEMNPILHDDILTSSQPRGIFKMRISSPAWKDSDLDPPYYLEPDVEHPLFTEAIDQALALCGDDCGPPHVKLVLEWYADVKASIIADDDDIVEEHSSVKTLRVQALNGGAPLTLEECLRDYTEAETLTDAWRCPHCQQYQPVVKTLDMWSLPDILIVHFKRFRQQGFRGGNSAKLTTMVDFPVYSLDMTPHLAAKRNASSTTTTNNKDDTHHHHHHHHHHSDSNDSWSPWKRSRKPSHVNDNIYDLYAICYHHGTDLETGHYTAACKNPYDSLWYLYDDSSVVNLSNQTSDVGSLLVNNSAYILFYQRRNGIYSASSSSSSAASTSSVGSSQEHWTCRMPKFVPPKKAIVNNINNSSDTKQQTAAPTPVITKEMAPKEDIFEERRHHHEENAEAERTAKEVALRNSQNALYTSTNSIKRALEMAKQKQQQQLQHSSHEENNTNSTSQPQSSLISTTPASTQTPSPHLKSNVDELLKKPPPTPLYTTSIYINAAGEVDIETTRQDVDDEDDGASPVLSAHRVNGIKEDAELEAGGEEEDVDDDVDDDDDDEVVVVRRKFDGWGATTTKKRDTTLYRTTASVHRYSDGLDHLRNKKNTGAMSFMSPQPTKKIHMTPQSV